MGIVENVYDLVEGRKKLTETDFMNGVWDRMREMQRNSEIALVFNGTRGKNPEYREIYSTGNSTIAIDYSGTCVPVMTWRDAVSTDEKSIVKITEKILNLELKKIR